MERVYISYLLITLLIVLGSLVAEIFVADYRKGASAKRDRAMRLREKERNSADREKALRDKYGL